jgi:hypothetical protein
VTDKKTYTLHPDAPDLRSLIQQFGTVVGDGVVPVWGQLPFRLHKSSPKPEGHLLYVSFQKDAYWIVDARGTRFTALPDSG